MTPATALRLPDAATSCHLLATRGSEPLTDPHLSSASESVNAALAGLASVSSPPSVERIASETSAGWTLVQKSSGGAPAGQAEIISLAAVPIAGKVESAEVLLAELARIAPWLLNGQLGRDVACRTLAQPGSAATPDETSALSEAATTSLEPAEIHWFDADLTPLQRSVVRQALKCGDVFLIQGPPASGKLPVVAELIRQWLVHGYRLLVTSPHRASLKALLERLESVTDGAVPAELRWPGEHFLVVYCPANEERLEPDSSVHRWLAEVRVKAWANSWRRRCWAALTACQAEADRLTRAVQLLEQLEELSEAYRQQRKLQQSCSSALQQLAEQFRRHLNQPQDTAPSFTDDAWGNEYAQLQEALHQEKRKHESCLADLHQRLQQFHRQLEEYSQQVGQWQEKVAWQEQIVAVKRARAFWRWLWWKNLFQARSGERLAEFQTRLQEAMQQHQASLQQCRELEQAFELEQHRHATARTQIIKTALEQRREQLEQDVQQTEAFLAELLKQWHTQREQLRQMLPDWECPETSLPAVEMLRQQREQCRRQQQQLASEAACLKQVLEALGQRGDGKPDIFAERAHLRVAPLDALLRQDALHRGERMIVLDAHEIPAEVWNSLRLGAGPMVLCGEPVRPATRSQRAAQVLATPTAEPEPNLLSQKWQQLCAGTVLPSCRWVQSASGITCQLMPMLSFRPGQLHVEPLADQPEVILRFVEAPPQGRYLAEVFFPSRRYDIRQAKTFLSNQMEQVYLWPVASIAQWREATEHYCCEWLPASAERFADSIAASEVVRVDYGQGISEELLAVSGSDGRTCWRSVRVCFEKSCGWTSASTQDWLREFSNHGPHPDAAWLWCWQGGTGPLSDWPTWVLGYLGTENLSGLWRSPAKPARRSSQARHRSDQADTVDLASDQRKRLPLAWQCILPDRGFIQPRHAEQLISRLRELVPTLRYLADSWWFVGWWEMPQLELLRWLWRQGQSEQADACMFFSLCASESSLVAGNDRNRCGASDRSAALAADGVLLVLESLPGSPDGVYWQDWIRCAALARRCLVLLEPDYEQLFRQLNARGYNSPWLSDLLQRVATLPVLPAHALSGRVEP